MFSKTALNKYLLSTKTFINVRYIELQKKLAPLGENLVNSAVKNKEIIFKALCPLLLISIAFYSCTASQSRISQNILDIFNISDDIRFRYANKPDYWGLSTQSVLQDGYISQSYIRNGKIYLSGGEEILIGSGSNADVIMPQTFSFDIVLQHLNQAQCISYAEGKISEENMVKLLRISIVNSTGVYSFEWGGNKYKLPITKYASKDICTHSNNTLIWTIQ